MIDTVETLVTTLVLVLLQCRDGISNFQDYQSK